MRRVPSLSHFAAHVFTLIAGLSPSLVAADAPATYESRLAAARAFAGENSHAHALAAYREALSLAPDENQRRWCQLWILHESLTQSTDETDTRYITAACRLLLDPYTRNATAPDAFWLAARELLASAEAAVSSHRALTLRLETARYWASQSPSPAAAASFAQSATALATALASHPPTESSAAPLIADALAFLRQVVPALPAGATRANVALLYARALGANIRSTASEGDPVRSAYDEALASARGTSTEPEAVVHRAVWVLQHSRFAPLAWNPISELGTRNSNLAIPGETFGDLVGLIDEALAANPKIAASSDLSFGLRFLNQIRPKLVEPVLSLTAGDVYLPDSRITFGLTAQHLAAAELSLHRLPLEHLHDYIQPLFRTAAAPAIPSTAPLRTWTLATGVTGPLGRTEHRHIWGEALAPGAYLLVARDPSGRVKKPATRMFLVSGAQAVATTSSDGHVEVWAYDQESGEPLPEAQITIRREHAVRSLTPTGTGFARVSIADWPSDWNKPITLVGQSAGHPFIVAQVAHASAEQDTWDFHLNTDRQLYLPGETVRWKITARHLVNGQLVVPRDAKFTVTAKLQRDAELGSWSITLNRFGTASGELKLPVSTRSDQAIFEITRTADPKSPVVAHVPAFVVDRFRPPEAVLTIAPLDADQIRRARAGRDVELTLTARYFSGEPIASVPISITTFFRRTLAYVGDAEDFSEKPSAPSVPSPLTLEAITDATGRARVRLALPAALPENFNVSVSARLAGRGLTSTADFAFAVSTAGYRATLSSPSVLTAKKSPPPYGGPPPSEIPRLYSAPGRPTSFVLSTLDGRDAPVAVSGELSIQRFTWEEIWRTPTGELLTGAALREQQNRATHWPPRAGALWEKLRAAYRVESISVETVATDATGRTTLSTPALAPGYYRVLYRADTNTRNNEPSARLDLFVADDSTTHLPFHLETAQPAIIPCDEAPVPGQPLRALVILPVGTRAALLQAAGFSSTSTRLERFSGDTRLVEFPWQPVYWAGVRFTAAAFNAGHAPVRAHLTPSRVDHSATVTLLPAATTVRPGEKSRVTLRTTDHTGRPLAVEVALAVADESLVSLTSLHRPSTAESFLAQRYLPWSSINFSSAAAYFGPAPAASLTQKILPPQPDDLVILSAFSVAAQTFTGGAALMASQASLAEGAVLAGTSVVEPRTRAKFTYTAHWQPEIETDANGEASVEIAYPDNLTAWRITAEAVADDNRFGHTHTTVRSTLPLQARLRTPRSLVAGDTVTLLGTLVNSTAAPLTPQTSLTSLSPSLRLSLPPSSPSTATVGAHSETPLAWTAHAHATGSAQLLLSAKSSTASDAMELTLPVREDGFEQRTGVTGRATDQPLHLTLALPAPLDRARTRVEIQVSPGIVPALLDSLPYLVDYPYGCVEQTVSRFLPAALVARLLRDLNFSAAEIEQRIFPSKSPAPPGRAPAAGVGQLDAVIAQSLARLEEAQLPNGGFGWFPRAEPDAYMTAYVLRGLNQATAAGLAVPEQLLSRTRQAVFQSLGETKTNPLPPTTLAWVLYSAIGCSEKPTALEFSTLDRVFTTLFAERAKLPHSALALLASVAHALERTPEVTVLRRNLANGVTRSTSKEFGDTAHWGRTTGYFDGLEGAVESTSLCLSALLAIDPRDPLVDAAASWLLLNRESNRWSNTRDTATAFLALHDYAKARGDTALSGGYRLTLNGSTHAEQRFDRATLLRPATLTIDSAQLEPGENQLTLTPLKGSRTACYLVATSQAWAAAERAVPAGDFLKITRSYARLTERTTLLGQRVAEPQLLPAVDARLTRNEQLECRLVLEVKHPLDYVAIESPKPAGCEPLNPLSGWDATLSSLAASPAPASTRPGQRIYREEHDDRSVFFLPHLPAGRWELRYTLRGTFAGDFRILPATTGAMYVPVIAANSEARRLTIAEKID